MATQITLNQFNALNLTEKLEMFGSYFFTARECTILKAMLNLDNSFLTCEDIANQTFLNTWVLNYTIQPQVLKTVSLIISCLNRKIDNIIDNDEERYTLNNDTLNRVICINELIKMDVINLIEEAAVEAKEDSEILIDLLKEEDFKAAVHPSPRRDILIKTQSGEIIITKSKKLGYLVDYIGHTNESFSVRGLNTHQDVITCLNNEFYKR